MWKLMCSPGNLCMMSGSTSVCHQVCARHTRSSLLCSSVQWVCCLLLGNWGNCFISLLAGQLAQKLVFLSCTLMQDVHHNYTQAPSFSIDLNRSVTQKRNRSLPLNCDTSLVYLPWHYKCICKWEKLVKGNRLRQLESSFLTLNQINQRWRQHMHRLKWVRVSRGGVTKVMSHQTRQHPPSEGSEH